MTPTVPTFQHHYLRIGIVALYNNETILIKKSENYYWKILVLKLRSFPEPCAYFPSSELRIIEVDKQMFLYMQKRLQKFSVSSKH